MSDETTNQLNKILNDILSETERHNQQVRASVQHFQEVWLGMKEPIGYAVYSQRDPTWKDRKLGTSGSSIGDYGCLMTSVASMLTNAGKEMRPDMLNTWLVANGGYTNGNLFVFNSVDKLGVVKFESIVDYTSKPAPVKDFDARVLAGDYVLVKVDFTPSAGIQEHWVRYIGAGECIDPWSGDIAKIVPRYPGKDAAQAILRAAIYRAVPSI